MKIIRPLVINDAILASSNVPETDYAAWSSATTYNLNDMVIYVAANVHQVYESAVASNLNNNPTTSPTKWTLVSATNRWKMFDQSNTTQTSNADSIAVTLNATNNVDSVAFLNCSASSVQVTLTSATDGVVFNVTESLISTSGINDWYDWFFEPIVRKTDFVIGGMPPYYSATLNITLSDTGNTVLCGTCVPGQSFYVGGTQLQPTFGIEDYSVKQQDSFGNYSIQERPFRNLAMFVVNVPPNNVDLWRNILAKYRSTPTVYIGDDSYGSTIVYGFYKDWSTEITYTNMSTCTINLEGLT